MTTLKDIPAYVQRLTEAWLSAPNDSTEEELLSEACDIAYARHGLQDADVSALVQDGPGFKACSDLNDEETVQHDTWAEAGGYDALEEEAGQGDDIR